MVSIIMLAQNSSKYLEESVRSVMDQTYQNWELLFVDDSSKDDSITKMMELRGNDKRFVITQTVFKKGFGVNRVSALKEARGRWITFLDCGDIWEPTKLEKQIKFMKDHDYGFSYSKYQLIDGTSKKRNLEISGPETITYQEMQKCCWPGAVTVMYDKAKIGDIKFNYRNENNDYALFLMLSEKEDCHLMDECLAYQRTFKNYYNPFPLKGKVYWRYEVFRIVEDWYPLKSAFLTVRNLWYSMVKKMKYAKKVY